MTDRAREVLNKLMGINRDYLTNTNEFKLSDDVCIYNLVSFCPYESLLNTKKSIGKCKYKHHEEYFKREYERGGKPNKESLELEYLKLIVEILLKTEINGSKSEIIESMEYVEMKKKIEDMKKDFQEMLEKAEIFGSGGNIDKALSSLNKYDKIRENLEKVKEAFYVKFFNAPKELCNVCGLIQSPTDTENKLQTHKNGKVHKTYERMRTEIGVFFEKYNINNITEVFPKGLILK